MFFRFDRQVSDSTSYHFSKIGEIFDDMRLNPVLPFSLFPFWDPERITDPTLNYSNIWNINSSIEDQLPLRGFFLRPWGLIRLKEVVV